MFSLLALALAAFGIGTTEFVVVVLLPDIARDLHATIPRTGLLVTVYALGVAAGAPIMAALTAKLARRTALLWLMALFLAGNLLCAIAPSYAALAVARVVTAFSHAAFFGIASVVAAEIGGRPRRGQAVALVFSGLTIANIVGVPAATALGQVAGWRAAFWVVCGIALATLVALHLCLPRGATMPGTRFRHELRAMARAPVLLAMLTSVLASASLFSVLTFITPILERVTHVPPRGISLVLLGFGVALTLGNQLGGWLSDWRLMPTVLACFLIGILALGLIPASAPHLWPMLATLLVWGLAVFTLGPPLQMQVMLSAAEAPNLASILNQGAFNLGNALGAWTGAAALGAGWAAPDTAYAGAAYAALGLIPSVILLRRHDMHRSAG